jgi:GntR family transcriptional regulator
MGGARGIDRSSPIPYYYQLQETLKEQIEHGTWQPNDLLPSESELERRFGVSRTVVRQALDVLQADGQIRRVKGKGSIVCEPKFHWEATMNARARNEAEPTVEVLVGKLIDQRRVPAGRLLGRLLEMGESDLLFELTFTQLVDRRPVALSQMYLRPAASQLLRHLLAADSPPAILTGTDGDALGQLARRYAVHPSLSHVTVEMTLVNDFEAEALLVTQGTPAFLLNMLDRDVADRPICFTRTVLRADRARISMTLRQDRSGSLDFTSLAPFITSEHPT